MSKRVGSLRQFLDEYGELFPSSLPLTFLDLSDGTVAVATSVPPLNAAAIGITDVQASVTTTPGRIVAVPVTGATGVYQDINLQADPANTGPIYLGLTSASLAATLTPPVILLPGQAASIAPMGFRVLSTSQIWARSVSGTQLLNVMAFSSIGGTVNGVQNTGTVLATNTSKEVLILADASNTANISIGGTVTPPTKLGPGKKMHLPISNSNLIYLLCATASQIVYFQARS